MTADESILKRYEHDYFIWQRFTIWIYPATEVIFALYYNENKSKAVLADQLKQVSTINLRGISEEPAAI
jgi:hypothetical protein